MNLVKGNLWDSKDPYIFVTTNSTVRKDGGLVMGRGAAKELCSLEPHLQFVFGKLVDFVKLHTDNYGVILVKQGGFIFKSDELKEKKGIGVFQVKNHFRDPATPYLIKFSTEMLLTKLLQEEIDGSVSMNFPGIGWGHLSYEEVLPIVSQLPNFVTLYMK